jgi:hypothetical protein
MEAVLRILFRSLALLGLHPVHGEKVGGLQKYCSLQSIEISGRPRNGVDLGEDRQLKLSLCRITRLSSVTQKGNAITREFLFQYTDSGGRVH